MTEQNQNITPDQEIAYHQGALNTLIKEREGLVNMLQIVEATMNGHVKRLQELGVQFEDPNKNK